MRNMKFNSGKEEETKYISKISSYSSIKKKKIKDKKNVHCLVRDEKLGMLHSSPRNGAPTYLSAF